MMMIVVKQNMKSVIAKAENENTASFNEMVKVWMFILKSLIQKKPTD